MSETMSTALERELQIAIMRHLLGQAPDAAIVPASVEVDAVLVDTSKEIDVIVPESSDPSSKWQSDRIPVGHVFELNASTICSWASISTDRLPAAAIQIPPPPGLHYRPFLFTTITTHGKHVLRTHDSSLTGIREITGIENLSAGVSVQFHYRLGANRYQRHDESRGQGAQRDCQWQRVADSRGRHRIHQLTLLRSVR